MESKKLRLPGLILFKPRIFRDDRGYFLESYRSDRTKELGLPEFVQDNTSHSIKNTVRALHFQKGQAKLVRVVSGSIFDVAVDIRPGSSTFGQWEGVILDDQLHEQLYIPDGFAHGFCALSETALVHYKVSSFYDPKAERSIRWNDPDIKINWPIETPLLSERDQKSPLFKELFNEAMDHRG